jgi:hypothetical protein
VREIEAEDHVLAYLLEAEPPVDCAHRRVLLGIRRRDPRDSSPSGSAQREAFRGRREATAAVLTARAGEPVLTSVGDDVHHRDGDDSVDVDHRAARGRVEVRGNPFLEELVEPDVSIGSILGVRLSGSERGLDVPRIPSIGYFG